MTMWSLNLQYFQSLKKYVRPKLQECPLLVCWILIHHRSMWWHHQCLREPPSSSGYAWDTQSQAAGSTHRIWEDIVPEQSFNGVGLYLQYWSPENRYVFLFFPQTKAASRDDMLEPIPKSVRGLGWLPEKYIFFSFLFDKHLTKKRVSIRNPIFVTREENYFAINISFIDSINPVKSIFTSFLINLNILTFPSHEGIQTFEIQVLGIHF